MKISLVFEDWQKIGQSVYETKEGVDLSTGPFHSGTTFEAEIQLEEDDEQELRNAMEKGYTPVFAVFEPEE